jgi:hypothetical protein
MLDLVLASVEAIIIAGTFGVVIMMIGYVYDRLVTWARMRPISISQSPIMAYSLTTGDPLTIAEASQIAKIVPPQNRDEEWRSTLTRFSFVSRWGGFGWAGKVGRNVFVIWSRPEFFSQPVGMFLRSGLTVGIIPGLDLPCGIDL